MTGCVVFNASIFNASIFIVLQKETSDMINIAIGYQEAHHQAWVQLDHNKGNGFVAEDDDAIRSLIRISKGRCYWCVCYCTVMWGVK